jgi:hypothetical protein
MVEEPGFGRVDPADEYGSQNRARRSPLLVVIAATMLFLTIMLFQMQWNDLPPIATATLLGGFSLVTFGLIVSAVWPNKGRWGLKIPAFVLFAVSFYVLIYELISPANSFESSGEIFHSPLLTALIFFGCFGVPAFLYTFWPCFTFRERTDGSKPVSKADQIARKVMNLALGLHVILAVVALGALVFRLILHWFG